MYAYYYYHQYFLRFFFCFVDAECDHDTSIALFFVLLLIFNSLVVQNIAVIAVMNGSRNRERLAVRANTGGYLRSPLEISSAFAASAEKHVRQIGPSTSSTTWRPGSRDAGEDQDVIPTRVWSRAGVGAGALSVKERKTQQMAAERVYGTHFAAGDEAEGRSSLQVEQQHMFGVDKREQETLRALQPRRLREARRRDRNDKKRSRQESDSTASGEEEARHTLERTKKVCVMEEDNTSDAMTSPPSVRSAPQYSSSTARDHYAASSSKRARVESEAAWSHSGSVQGGSRDSKTPHATSVQSPAEKESLLTRQPTRDVGKLGGSSPVNRMQLLQQQREAALFSRQNKGKKK